MLHYVMKDQDLHLESTSRRVEVVNVEGLGVAKEEEKKKC